MTRPTDTVIDALIQCLQLESNEFNKAWEISDGEDDESLGRHSLLISAANALQTLRTPITDEVVEAMAIAYLRHRLGPHWPANSWEVISEYQKAKERNAMRAALKAGGLA